ncbi:MAG: nucleoside-diphosphate kinase [Carbonactinosporaceae bacterium]
MTERTLVLLKPDAVRRGLVGEILARIERKGLRLVALDMRAFDRATLEKHYAEHAGKSFFEPLLEFMTSGPGVAAVVEGERAVAVFRTLAGATDPAAAAAGTIRGDLSTDFGTPAQQNLVHGSDSPEAAARELALFFPDHLV